MSSPDPTTRPATDRTVVLPCLAVAQEPWFAILRQELTDWQCGDRIDEAYWVHDGVRGIVAMERDILVLEAHSTGCAGSVADLAPRILDLQQRGRELVWRIDTARMTISGSVVCRDALRMSLDEIAARLMDLMQRVRAAKPILDGRIINTCLVDLDCRAGQMDGWIRCEIRMARTKPCPGLPAFLESLRTDLEAALKSALGFSHDELQGIIDDIGRGRLDEEDVRRLIGYLRAEREAYDLLDRHGMAADKQRVYQMRLIQESTWEQVNLRSWSRKVESTARAEEPSATSPEGRTAATGMAGASTAAAVEPAPSAGVSSGQPAAKPSSATDAARSAPVEPRSPQFFTDALSRLVMGQDEAVRAWALALHQHEAGVRGRGAMLFDGPTGCGKSHLGTCAADLAGVPFIHVNAASLVPEGIVGQTLSDVCIGAISRANGKVDEAECAIILFDEIDKLSDAVSGNSGTKYAREIIHQLLRFLDGCDYHIDSYKTPNGKKFPQTLSTRRMQIAFAGAWTCLRSMSVGSSIGFTAAPVTPASEGLAIGDLGLPLEMVGRISKLVHLQPHTRESLMAILRSEAASPLRAIRSYLAQRHASLTIDEQLLQTMAQEAIDQGTGARGLATIVQFYTECIYWHDPVHGKRFHLTGNGTLQVTVPPVVLSVAS
jgi:ATP-dependent Clp protease ATP-binding subunit ClpX